MMNAVSGLFPRDLFDDSHSLLRRQVAGFLDEEIVGLHRNWSQARYVPRDIWRKAGEAGLLCRSLPVEYGGHGRDFRDSVVIIEELAARRLPGLPTYLQSDIVAPLVQRLGTAAQKQRFLPGLCDGNLLGAMALTEPHSGSDLHAFRSFARRDGDDFVLNGVKTHISNGNSADLIIVAARCDKAILGDQPGFVLLLVEAGRDGISRKAIAKAGMQALDTATITFEDCRVPACNLLGQEGLGFMHLMQSLVAERLVLAVFAQASAETLLRETIAACHARQTSAGTLLDYQHIRFRLADLYSDCSANRAFVDQCITAQLRNRTDPKAACIAKLRCTENLKDIATQALQLRGAAGISEAEGERCVADLVDASVQTIWGGSSEVMRDLIGRGLVNLL